MIELDNTMRQNIWGANRHIYITPKISLDHDDVFMVLESIGCELFEPGSTADYESVYFPVFSQLPRSVIKDVLSCLFDDNINIYESKVRYEYHD
jgi:hypothetical protein